MIEENIFVRGSRERGTLHSDDRHNGLFGREG
jgi:hypothetical protein